jgi:hypothetical protein
MTKLYTTLNLLRKHNACKSGYAKVRAAVGAGYDKDEQIDLLTVLDGNGIFDTLWALRAANDRGAAMSVCAEFAQWCAAAAAADASRAAAADAFHAADASRAASHAAAAAASARAARATPYASNAASCAYIASADAALAAHYDAAVAHYDAAVANDALQIEKLRELLS